MNQRLMISIEKTFNEFSMQLNMPVGAPWGDAFVALDEIINVVKDLAAKDQEKQQQIQKENTENQESTTEVTEVVESL